MTQPRYELGGDRAYLARGWHHRIIRFRNIEGVAPNRTALIVSPRPELICRQCGHKFVIVDPGTYGCGGWQYRGQSVCSNTIKVSCARLWSRSCCLPFSVIFSPRKGSCTLSRKSFDCSPNVAQELERLFGVSVYPPIRGMDARQTS
jgi:hypothetical protein